jgi:hypothetical protein
VADIIPHPSAGEINVTPVDISPCEKWTRPEDAPQSVRESLAALHQVAQKAKNRFDPLLRKATKEELALAELLHVGNFCHAHSIRTGLPCRRKPVPGGAVCMKHGAQYKHVKAARDKRLEYMVGPAMAEMYKMAMAPKHTKVKREAAADILDRAGVGAVIEAKVRQSFRGVAATGLTVQIGFLQTMKPQQIAEAAHEQSLLPAADVIDGETAEAPGDRGAGDGDAAAAPDGGHSAE